MPGLLQQYRRILPSANVCFARPAALKSAAAHLHREGCLTALACLRKKSATPLRARRLEGFEFDSGSLPTADVAPGMVREPKSQGDYFAAAAA